MHDQLSHADGRISDTGFFIPLSDKKEERYWIQSLQFSEVQEIVLGVSFDITVPADGRTIDLQAASVTPRAFFPSLLPQPLNSTGQKASSHSSDVHPRPPGPVPITNLETHCIKWSANNSSSGRSVGSWI